MSGCGRTLVTIEQPVTTTGSTGGRTITWTQVAKVLASSLVAVKGREDTSSVQGDRQAAIETWLLKIPFRSDLVAITDHRAVIDEVNYNIRSAMDRTRRRMEITMELERGVAV